jgi:hypothetical protein
MFQNIPKEKVLEILKQGPTIPSKISRQLSSDTVLIGAILSTLINQGTVRVSTLKIGGTPVYYLPEQEPRLEEYMQYLNDKDQKTARLLKDCAVLQDNTQDPLVRVSLRAIKDFARQIELENNGSKELFWRYFLVQKEEAELLVRKILIEAHSKKEADAAALAAREEQDRISKEEIIKASEKKAPLVNVSNISEQIIIEKSSEKAHVQKEQSEEHIDAVTPEDTGSAHETPSRHKSHTIHAHTKHTHNFSDNTLSDNNTISVANSDKVIASTTDFLENIKQHLLAKNLDIISKEKIKKTEYHMVLKDHSTNEYLYCAAKDKKTITEGDISTAYVFAHTKKMPCIFLMTGTLNKKATQMVEKEFAGIRIEKLNI